MESIRVRYSRVMHQSRFARDDGSVVGKQGAKDKFLGGATNAIFISAVECALRDGQQWRPSIKSTKIQRKHAKHSFSLTHVALGYAVRIGCARNGEIVTN
jgi:hypothetical protein